MSLLVRFADPVADFAAILKGAGEFVRLVNRPDLFPEPDSDELAGVIRKLTAVPGFYVQIVEHDGRMVAGIGYWIGPYLMSMSKVECQEIFWWSDASVPSAAMRALRAMNQHGREQGCHIKTMHRLMSSPAGVDNAYRHLGAEPIQITHMGRF